MRKRLMSIVLATLAVLVAASPAMAAWFIDKSTGQPGHFDYSKWPAIVCTYRATTQTMKTLTVRPPTLWGTHDDMTAVGWRFQVREAIPFVGGAVLFRSQTFKGSASKTVASTFAAHTWTLRTDTSSSHRYYVQYFMFWYAPGSKSMVDGKVVATPDQFQRKLGTQTNGSVSGCDYNDWQWPGTD